MKITERLDVEHQLLLQEFDDVAGWVRAGALPAVWHGAARTIVHALGSHFALEERVFFHALRATRPEWIGLVAELESEHRLVEHLGRELDREASPVVLLKLVDLLHAHAEKEARVVFPLAEPAQTQVEQLPELLDSTPRILGDWPECWLG